MGYFDDYPNENYELMGRLTDRGKASIMAKKDGKCTHGWRKGILGKDLETCQHCQKTATREELDQEANEIFLEYL